MDKKLIELIEKIGRVKLLVEEIPYLQHTMGCHTNDMDSLSPCNCKAGGFNIAVSKVKRELGIK